MAYVLVIISFVAMGGPKATTPTIDHIEFSNETLCNSAREDISAQLQRAHVVMTAKCYPK